MKTPRIPRILGFGAVAFTLALTMITSANAAEATPATKATDPCGNHTHQVLDTQYRYWRNCITTSEKINIDKILWPDEKICVAAGSDTPLGPTNAVRGASRVGDC
ncbi:hypothetical protein [Streptomyces sp. NBC_01012]|uniref:hypothetical protein n=1 Tax=Streptomyces sp. NBC_01012 TaxID=2903717 RepID=UPI0038681846|nr:hypothetical protein OG623_34150 [Streptomyces sp. NBC_01012]